MKPPNILTKTKAAWSADGLSGLLQGWSNVRRRFREEWAYRRWMANHKLTDDRRNEIENQIASLKTRMLISVVLPVYNVDEKWLRKCIDSVLDQIYTNWQLCIADDASTAPHVRPVLEEYAAKDRRVRVVFREKNGHISAASNSALELAEGEFVVLLDHDDELSADALFWVANEVSESPNSALIYSDEDLIDERGRRFAPKFKPDFSRDLLYSLNLLTHLSAYRTDLVRSVGGFREGFEGSQDYDLDLRVLERIDESQIGHIPRVLYHWRAIRGSVAFSMDEKPYAHERARNAIREHLERTGVRAEVLPAFSNLHRVSYKIPAGCRTCVITTPGAKMSASDIGDVELITTETSTTNLAHALNEAAGKTDADVLIFIDGDLMFGDPSDIDELASFAMQPDIGTVGGAILYRGRVVEQAGIILGPDLAPLGAHRGFPRDAPGNIFRNREIGNYSAVSTACMAIRRQLFIELGLFDNELGPSGLFDIDLCLRLREKRKRIVVLPHVELIRERRTHGRKHSEVDLERFRERWPAYVEEDPFCNPNLERDGTFAIKG